MFHFYPDLPRDLRLNIINEAVVIHSATKVPELLDEYGNHHQRYGLARLVVINHDWQTVIESLLFERLRLDADDFSIFRKIAWTAPRSLLVQHLHVHISLWDHDVKRRHAAETPLANIVANDLLQVFDVLKDWDDRSGLHERRLLSLYLDVRGDISSIQGSVRPDFSEFPQVPVIAKLFTYPLHSRAKHGWLHPCSVTTLLRATPNVHTTNIILSRLVGSCALGWITGDDAAGMIETLPLIIWQLLTHTLFEDAIQSTPTYLRNICFESIRYSTPSRREMPGPPVPLHSLSLPISNLGARLRQLESMRLDRIVDVETFLEHLQDSTWHNLRKLVLRGGYQRARGDDTVPDDGTEEASLFAKIPGIFGSLPSLTDLQVAITDLPGVFDPTRAHPGPRAFELLFSRFPAQRRVLNTPPGTALLRTLFFEPPRQLVPKWREAVTRTWGMDIVGYWARNRLAANFNLWDEGGMYI